ncbi:MAG: hypothetical protein WBJ33_09170 [Candidatus Nanopelagicales bacterium]|jgi:hypothetical protein
MSLRGLRLGLLASRLISQGAGTNVVRRAHVQVSLATERPNASLEQFPAICLVNIPRPSVAFLAVCFFV